MRVLVVCTTGGYGRRQFGGAEHLLVQMLPAFTAMGIEILAGTPDDAVAAALREAGVPWIDLGAHRRVDVGYAAQIRRELRRFRPDIVVAHLLSAAMHCRAALAVDQRRLPLVVALHNSLWQYREAAHSVRARASIQVNIALDLTLRRLRPHLSVAVSEYEAAQLRTRGRVRRVQVIPNPLPPQWPAPPAPGPARPTGRVRVGFMGRLETEKGADLLGDVARALPEADFLIAGSGTVDVPALPNVELVGHVDPARFLPRLDCLLVPSRVESFGMSALQALSLGIPVVHSGVGGLAEVTGHADGILGFTAAGTPSAIGAAVRTATSGATTVAQRLSTATWYQREFAFARAVRRWSDLYRTVSHESG
jgi:glycosyltransferase involved in cell wall biosynthesis